MSATNNRRDNATLRQSVVIPAIDKKTDIERPLQKNRWVTQLAMACLIALIVISTLLTIGPIDSNGSHSFNPFQSISNLVRIRSYNLSLIARQAATVTEAIKLPTAVIRNHTATPVIQQPTTTPTQANSSSSGVTGYHVVGKQILDNQGNVYIPYGAQLVGLDNPNWRTYPGTDHLNQEEVNAAKQIWHSNIISIQLNTAALFASSPYKADYLAKVDQVVSWANQQNMNVLIVLQYQESTQQPLPTQDTIRFWDFISKHFINNPRVFFDLFNEPHTPNNTHDDATAWAIWRDGGTVNNTTYVGMQQLVNTIRNNGNQNLIFADGLGWATDIILLNNYLLTGSNIVYAVHPDIKPTDPSNPQATWDLYYGNIIRAINVPVIADEWSDSQDPRGCLQDASTVVPQLLTYLHQQKMGLIVWGLFPGLMIRGWDYTKPTAYDQPNYSCNEPWPSYDPNAKGPGQLVLDFFETQNP